MIDVQIDGIEYRFFDHLYAVSRCGKVLRKLAPYTPTIHAAGYLILGRRRFMHRVVAICWIPNPEAKTHVHHINGIKSDNRADNLEWVTPKEHMAERHQGTMGRYIRTDETREKLRQYRTGRKTSDETKEKQRAALLGKKRPFFPRSGHTDESRLQRSLAHHRNTQCKIFNIIYRSFSEASRATGIHKGTLRKRCLSENFPEYEIIVLSLD